MFRKMKFFLVIVLIVMLFSLSIPVSFSEDSPQNCEDINYSDYVFWESILLQGLHPIKDYQGNLIKKPVGCIDGE